MAAADPVRGGGILKGARLAVVRARASCSLITNAAVEEKARESAKVACSGGIQSGEPQIGDDIASLKREALHAGDAGETESGLAGKGRTRGIDVGDHEVAKAAINRASWQQPIVGQSRSRLGAPAGKESLARI